MWTDFALKDLAEPFRLWYIYADTSKRRTADHERLLRLYRRSKNRKKCHRILKAWKHLVSVERSTLRSKDSGVEDVMDVLLWCAAVVCCTMRRNYPLSTVCTTTCNNHIKHTTHQQLL